MTTLTEILNNPEEHYPGNFDTPQRANALLTGLCQDAAIEIERLQKREWVGLSERDKDEIIRATERDDRGYVMALVEAKLKEKNNA